MFELEKAIGEWRGQMTALGVNSAEVLDELESHLRDEIENSIRSGLDEKSAFRVAIDHIGDPASLQAEFVKNCGQGAGSSKSLKVLYRTAAAFVLVINTWTLLAYDLTPSQRWLAITAVAIISSYLAFVPHWLARLPACRLSLLATLIKVTTAVVWLWPIVALLEAEQVLHLGLGILPATLSWCLYAAVVMTAVAFGLIHGTKPDRDAGPPPAYPSTPLPGPRRPPSPADLFSMLPRSKPIDPMVQQCLESARDEASRLGHSFIGTEHLLLALLKGAEGSFAILLKKLGLEREAVRVEIEKLISPVAVPASTARNRLTPRAQKAIRLAGREAKAMNHSVIEAADLLIGLLREGSGIGARALRRLGVGIEAARHEILCELPPRSIS